MKTHISAALRFFGSASVVFTSEVAAGDDWSQRRMVVELDICRVA